MFHGNSGEADSERAGVARCRIVRWKKGQNPGETDDHLAAEAPLEIRAGGRGIAVTMRTPGHDAELAAGFLVSEGVLQRSADLIEIAHCRQSAGEAAGNILNVFFAPGVALDLEKLTRHVFASSSCGLCGKASIDTVHQQFPPVRHTFEVAAEVLLQLPEKLRAAQSSFTLTGGLHAAGLFDAGGQLLLAREDVGRHNAVDKVIGRSFLDGELPLHGRILLVSGRASFEIVQKALAAGIEVIAAVSAPSDLAVELASESGQTLTGFLRGQGMNVYSHSERVRFAAGPA